jgi:hypothetical protein
MRMLLVMLAGNRGSKEMPVDAIRLADQKTILELDEQMRLKEYGGDSYNFTRPVHDTWALLQLLKAHEAEIQRAYNKQSGEVAQKVR